MAELRWILLILGLLFLAGVYLYSKGWFGKGAALRPKFQIRREPVLTEEENDVLPAEVPQQHTHSDNEPEPDTEPLDAPLSPRGHDKIVTIRMLPKSGQLMPGKELTRALHAAGLQYGKLGIFHQIDSRNPSRTLFSVASLVEPGSFDLNQVEESEYPGISMFMVLPGPNDMLAAFDEMLSTARSLAQSLGANLFDERGSTLSVQRVRFMREELVEFQHQNSRANALCG